MIQKKINNIKNFFSPNGWNNLQNHWNICGMAISGMDYKILWTNTCFANMLNQTNKCLINKNILKFIDSKQTKKIYNNIIKPAKKSGFTKICETILSHNKKKKRTRFQAFILYDNDDNSLQVGWLFFFQDITKEFLYKYENKIIKRNLMPLLKNNNKPKLNLTKTEFKIAKLIQKNMSTKEIANHTSVSTQTINVHRANIRKKMKITNKKQDLYTELKKITL